MDPFSISTAVGSLLGLTETLALVLHDFISNVQDAPHSAQEALFAVKEMGFALSSAQRLLSDLFALRPTRKAMVELDHLIITITQSVITFKELESLICLEADAKSSLISIRSRLKWAWKEELVSRAVVRLQGHKSSLSLLLNILQCESDLEARVAQQNLHNMMEQLLLNDQDMRTRLARIENNQFLQKSAANAIDDDASTIRAPSSRTHTITDIDRPDIVRTDTDSSTLVGEHLVVIGGESEFEAVLGASRVYRRVTLDECDVSFTSSNGLSHAWSALSGFSLADISVTSVIALPLDLEMVAEMASSTSRDLVVGHGAQEAQKSCAKLEAERDQVPAMLDHFTGLSSVQVN